MGTDGASAFSDQELSAAAGGFPAAELNGGRDAQERAERIRVVLADPDPLARRVIRDGLQARDGFVIVAEAKNGVEAIELATYYKPELLLTEVSLPGLDGVEACRRVIEKAPQVRVVMLTVQTDREVEIRAVRAGAVGYLSKDTSAESLVRSLRGVVNGEAAVSRTLTMQLIEMFRRTSDNGIGLRPVKSVLTSREWEILDLMCTGAATRDISEVLYVSEDTVYSHIKSILRKLGVHSRAEAVSAAEKLRWPSPV